MSGEYYVEFAKSGRANCKKCKNPIEKGAIRIATETQGPNEYNMVVNVHPECFSLPRRYSTGPDKITVAEFVDDILHDRSGGEILPAKRDELITKIEGKAPPSKGAEEAKGLYSEIKAAYEGTEPPTKKQKGEQDSSSLVTPEAVQAFGLYHKHKNDELKDLLRWNRQIVGGTRPYLMIKVIDGHVHGRLASCSLCGGGKLKLHEDGVEVTCNGIFDEESRIRIDCAYKGTASEAPRWKPWYSEEPSESEKEEMDRLEAEAKGEETKKDSDNPTVAALQEAASKLDWKLTSKDGMRKATADLIKVLRSADEAIDLPTDETEAKQKVVAIISGHRQKTPEEIVLIAVNDLGFCEDKKKKADKKEAAVSSIIKNPKNTALVNAFQELAELYFKEGNGNAGSSYVRAVNALKDLEFEITEENAPGLSKGKTKVKNIGKSTGEKIVEFVQTGSIAKLEEKRSTVGS